MPTEYSINLNNVPINVVIVEDRLNVRGAGRLPNTSLGMASSPYVTLYLRMWR